MAARNEKIDAYIAKSAEFAQPILNHLRELVHAACPEIEETLKWSFPHFDYKGMLCSMAAFKQHCTFGFWKASLMQDLHKLFVNSSDAMGKFGQIKRLEDLPSNEILIAYIKEAVELNKKGVKLPAKSKNTEKKELAVPEFFVSALEGNAEAAEIFEKFSYSHKKEYIEWLTEAKTEETRNKRLSTAIEWLTQGKSRHWKYAAK